MKRIDRFAPAAGRSVEECDRHYLEIHHAFAREMFRAPDSSVRLYVAHRALGQYDITGGFNQTPEAWRYVIEEVAEDGPAANAFIPQWAKATIWRDHTRCLRDFRGYEVEPVQVLDRFTGQLILVKYLFEYHRPDAMPIAEADAYYESEHLPALREALSGAFGFRRFVTNRVTRVLGTDDDEGHVISAEWSAPGRVYRFDEFWFDNVGWGGEVFRRPDLVRLFHAGVFADVQGYLVDQRCGVDHA